MAHQKPSLLDEGWGDWLSDQQERERLQRLRAIGIDEGLIQEPMGLVESAPSEDEKMFKENEQFYKDHPRETLELEPMPYHTQFGRRVYKDQFGVVHSETTATVRGPSGGWMNVPTIFRGQYVTDDAAREKIINNGMLDPENGETIKLYKTIEEAEEAAKQRMRELNDPSLPWNLEGLDWIINFPFEHLDWLDALPDWLGNMSWPPKKRKSPNLQAVPEWNP